MENGRLAILANPSVSSFESRNRLALPAPVSNCSRAANGSVLALDAMFCCSFRIPSRLTLCGESARSKFSRSRSEVSKVV